MSDQPAPSAFRKLLDGLLTRGYRAFVNRSARSKFAGGILFGGFVYVLLALIIIVLVTSGPGRGVAFAVVFASAALGALVVGGTALSGL